MTANDLTTRVLQDWRDQCSMLSTVLSGLAEQYDQHTREEACELLSGLASALDDCAGSWPGPSRR